MNDFEMGRLVKGDWASRVRERKVQTGAEIRAMRSLALQREGGVSQGQQGASRSWKGHRYGFSLLQKQHSPAETLMSDP